MVAKKESKVTVIMTNAAGAVYVWHAKAASVHADRDGKVWLNVAYSDEAGTFVIEVPRGGYVEVTP